MEFYLVDELECDLTIFHPYRTLMTLCGKEGGAAVPEAEAGEADADDVDGLRYWGTGEGKLELQEGALQMAWYVLHPLLLGMGSSKAPGRFIINDTYRSELCLLYPPHLVAIAAIYLTLVFHAPTRTSIQQSASSSQPHSSSQHSHPGSPTRRSSHSASHSQKKQQHQQDVVGFMAGLNVSMNLVATIAQEIISLYALWDRYSEDPNANADSAKSSFMHKTSVASGSGATRRAGTRSGRASGVIRDDLTVGGDVLTVQEDSARSEIVTPTFLVQLLVRMREQRMADLAHPASGRPVAVNKMLERTQAAG